ncbi:hypothetical protein MKX03_004202 [Papaver bracteatum]|nr:hypothetical protein MKX03_004202 [Papaver bracteatum]
MIGLRSHSILPSTIPIPRVANGSLSSFVKNLSSRISTQLSGSTEKQNNVLPPSPEKEDQRPQREFVELNAEPLTPPAFDLSAEFTHPDKAIMDVLSDFVEKNRGSPIYHCLLIKLLASARLRELGVGYNVIPIPDKQEWKASWHEEGKPNWLGTILTAADGRPKLSYTASVTGCIEKDGGKGGYGVVLFDHFGRPKVASVGVSLKGKLPLIYYDFQGVRSALQLAFDHGFGMKSNCIAIQLLFVIFLIFVLSLHVARQYV